MKLERCVQSAESVQWKRDAVEDLLTVDVIQELLALSEQGCPLREDGSSTPKRLHNFSRHLLKLQHARLAHDPRPLKRLRGDWHGAHRDAWWADWLA